MFDTTILKSPDTIRVNTTITEKRAPTDESVRLLREMEDKAKQEVIKAVEVKDNNFSAVLHHMHDYLSCCTKLRLIYSINGKKLTTDYSISDFKNNPDEWIPELVDTVAKDIASHILRDPVTNALKQMR